MIKLSILVPSVHERRNTFLPKSLDMLYGQWEALPPDQQKEVEILYLVDNKQSMLGQKRNDLIRLAQGEYAAFVDDDDRISPDYLKTLLDAINKYPESDVIAFQAEVTINGGEPKICYYSKDNKRDYNSKDAYYRIPNHITCIRKSVSLKSSFPSIKHGEDSAYSKLLLPHLKTEHKIDKILYYYDYNEKTTVAQEDLPKVQTARKVKPILDIIFISNASSSGLRVMTQRAIDSCLATSDKLPVNVIVMEQAARVAYKSARTIHVKEPFNYNAYANRGIAEGSADWVMVCNNDLTFRPGWLNELLAAGHPVVSPKCPDDKRQHAINENTTGTEPGVHLSGWAMMFKRSVHEQIGGLDEDFEFWFADNSFIEQLKAVDIAPMLVPRAKVVHAGSVTLRRNNTKAIEDFTWGQVAKFNEKYKADRFINHLGYKRYLQRRHV